MSIAEVRQWYAEEIAFSAGIQSESIVRAFATVPREHFLGDGPWRVRTLNSPYRTTPSDDPRHVYHNVLIAIDEQRGLNNGMPSWLAGTMNAANLKAGDQVVHIGAGVGYYSAILAEIVGPTGHVTAIEVDPRLAEIAIDKLRGWQNVSARHANGSDAEFASADVIFVNAGASFIQETWVERLRPNGRLLVPLTYSREAAGRLFRIVNLSTGFSAESLHEVYIYPCDGSTDETSQKVLREAVEKSGWNFRGKLCSSSQAKDESCWAAFEHYWLSSEQ